MFAIFKIDNKTKQREFIDTFPAETIELSITLMEMHYKESSFFAIKLPTKIVNEVPTSTGSNNNKESSVLTKNVNGGYNLK